MRILFLSRYQFPYITSGGTGVVVYELMNEFKHLGHTVAHWTWNSKGRKTKMSVEGMVGFSPIADVGSRNLKISTLSDIHATGLSMMARFDQVNPFDVVHVHTWEMFLVAIMAKYFWKTPCLSVVS